MRFRIVLAIEKAVGIMKAQRYISILKRELLPAATEALADMRTLL